MKRLRTCAVAVCVAALLVLGAVPAFAVSNTKNVYTTTPSKTTASSQYVLDKTLSGTYTVRSILNTNMYLDMNAGYLGNGGKVQIWGNTSTSAQKWTFFHQGNGVYKILNAHSTKALQAPSTTSKSGVALQQWSYTGAKNQLWRAYTCNKKTVLVNVATGMAVDVRGGKKTAGTVVQQATRTNATTQQWLLSPQKIIAVDYIKLGKTSLNLTVGQSESLKVTYYPSVATGSKQVTWTSSNPSVAYVSGGRVVAKRAGTAVIRAEIQKKWHTCTVNVKAADVVDTSIRTGYYMVKSALGGYYLDVDGGFTGWGGKIQLWQRTDATPQIWYIENKTNGIYTFTNVNSELALDVANGSKAAGLKMRQWHKNGSVAQQWKAYKRNGKTVFVNVASGRALDVEAGIGRNGSYVQQWDRNNTAAQDWTLERVNGFFDDALASKIFNQYRAYRSSKGLNMPNWSDACYKMAKDSARGCARLGRLEHRTGIPGNLQYSYSDILQYSSWKKTPAEAIEKWHGSLGHRKMMQCNSGTTAAGVAVYYDCNQNRYYYVIVYNFVGCNQNQNPRA